MGVRAPLFWFKEESVLSKCLAPLACAYQAGANLHKKYTGVAYKSSLPVICIGNVVSGGAGKTPAVQAIVDLLRKEGIFINPAILLRGHGGKISGPSLVVPQAHNAAEVGDEALLHAGHAQTIVAKKRDLGARLAELGGNDLIVMDDGLQNYTLKKDISFLVFDTDQGLENSKTLPAGPLREPLDQALKKVQAIIKLGEPPLPFDPAMPVFKAAIEPREGVDFLNPVIAFAGIGRPEKFFQTLEKSGANIIESISFADHHSYSEKEIVFLIEKANKAGADLYTTEKDYVRLPPSLQDQIKTMPVHMVFANQSALLDFLSARLHS